MTITVTPTSEPARISLAAVPTVSGLAAPNVGISKTTVIILAVCLPLIVVLAVAAVWGIRRTRHKQHKSRHGQEGNLLQRWFAKTSKLWSAENKSVDDLPWQMPDGEGEEAKDGRHPFIPSPPVPVPHAPRLSPIRPAISQPQRPYRPTSLYGHARDAMRPGNPGSYTPGTISESDKILLSHSSAGGAGDSPQQSWECDQMEVLSRSYDGTRKAFYEAALNRNLPFDKLARPSLRLDLYQQSDPDRSLAPDPLRIVKSTDAVGIETDKLYERDGGTRRAYTELLDPRDYMPPRASSTLDRDLMGELSSIDNVPIDDETRTRQREATLSYLEGVLPMSPPTSYRASSVYSRSEWGSPILDREEYFPPPTGQNETAGEVNREPEGKGKAVDRLGDGGKWI